LDELAVWSAGAMVELLRLVSLRHVIGSPLRSLLVLFGIALGVATMVATIAVNRSILGAFREMVDRVSGKADLIVSNAKLGVPGDLVEAIRSVDGVAHVAGMMEVTTRRPGGDGPLLVLGVDFLGDAHFLPIAVENGEDVIEDPVSVVNDPSAILISRTLADETGAKIDGDFPLLTPDGTRAFKVRGILENEGLGATFGGEVALMFTEAAQAAFGRGDSVDRIDIALKDKSQIARVEAGVMAVVEGRALVERPEGRTKNLDAITGPMRRGLAVGGAIALLVGMFLIYNAVGVSVAQRQKEIGVLRALGVTRRRMVMLFCLEALVLAVVGGFIGLALALGLSRIALAQGAPVVSRFYAAVRPPAPSLTLDMSIEGILVGLATTLFAAYFPARQAAKVDPVDPIRRATHKLYMRELPHRRMGIAALFFLIPGIVGAQFATDVTAFGSMFCFLIAFLLVVPAMVIALRRAVLRGVERMFGIPGRVAIDNAERSLGRSALTVGALMTAVSSSVSVGAWGVSLQESMYAWLEQSLPADLYVTSGSFIADQHNVPFRPDVVPKLRGIPGVEALYPVRIVSVDVKGKRIQLATVDMHIYFDELRKKALGGRPPIEGPSPIDAGALTRRPSVVLGENAARKLNLHAGDALELQTNAGLVRFEVYAVVVDYTSDQGACLIDRKWYLEYWKDDLVDTVDVFLDRGVELTSVREAIKARLGGEDTLFVVSAAEVREEIRKVLDQALQVFSSTDLLALMVALLGVIGTMFAAVLDRIREIGVLRAIGATRRQIALLIMLEAGFLGLVAAIAGVLAGVPMGVVFVRVVGLVGTGWHVDYLFPIARSVRVAGLVVITAFLAGLLPARRAAKLPVTEALAYE
jgi:putative ABC transport system permease protein